MTIDDEGAAAGSGPEANGHRSVAMAAYLVLPLAILATAPVSCTVAAGGDRCLSLTALVILAYPLWLIYTVPTTVALWRGVPVWRSVAAINVLAGWTVAGWVVALQRAMAERPKMAPADHGPAPSPAAGWTPQLWSPPPAGYPLPDEPLMVAEPPAPTYRARADATPVGDGPTAALGWPADAPAWVREGEWSEGALIVQLSGGFEAYSHGDRITDGLKTKQAVCFLWLTLLLNDLLSPGRALRRDSFADEMSPGIDGKSQRAQLSNRLHDLGNLDHALGRVVRADKLTIALDRRAGEGASELVSDLGLLHDLADVGRRDARFADAELPTIERLIEACQAEALPEWDALDERIAKRRGAGGQLIEALRERQREDMATVMLAAAQAYLEGGAAPRAAELLRSALELKPDREDIARRLVAALTAAGRVKEADTVHREYLQ